MNNILRFLSKLDLTPQEAKTLMGLIIHGRQSVSQLSKNVDINRVTIYRILDRLISIGYAIQIENGSKKLYSTQPLSIFEEVMDQKQNEAVDLAKNYLEVFPQLQKLYSSRANEIQITHYTGRDQARELCWNSLQAEGMIKSFGYRSLREIIGVDFLVKWWNETIERNIPQRILANPETFDMKKTRPPKDHPQFLDAGDLYEKRTFSKKEFPILHETFIYNNTYSILHWDNTNIFGVEIKHPQIAKQQEIIFDNLWAKAEEYKD